MEEFNDEMRQFHSIINFEIIFKLIDESFFLLNKEYQILYANPSAVNLLKLSHEDIIGKKLPELLLQDPGLSKLVINTISAGEKLETGYFLNENRRWYDVTALALNGEYTLIFKDIHHHASAREELRQRESHLRKVLDSIPNVGWVCSPDGEVTAMNRRWEEYTGLAAEGGLDSLWAEIVHPDDREQTLEAWQQSVKMGQPFEHECRWKRSDGVYRWQLDRTVPAVDENHNIWAWVGTATDIHEQKLAEERSLETEKHLREVLDTIPHIIFITDAEGTPLYYNKQWTMYRGLTGGNDALAAWQLSIHPDDKTRLEELGRTSAESRDGSMGEFRLKHIDGEYRWHIVQLIPLKNNEGEIVEWIGTGSDIHELKLAEQESRESNNYIQKITETSPAVITVFDVKEQKYVYASNKMILDVGTRSNDVLDRSLEQVLNQIHPDDREKFLRARTDVQDLEDDDIRELEFRSSGRAGELIWLKSRTKVFERDENGEVCRIISITENITDIKQSTEELSYSNNLLREITEATPDYISIFDLSLNRYVYINKAIRELWLFGEDETTEMGLNVDLLGFIHPEDQSRWQNHINGVIKNNNDEVAELTFQAIGPDGGIWIKGRSKIFKRDENGNVLQIINIGQNVTAELEAQETQKENERIQSLMQQKDELFSIASHELKTPITSMKAGLQVVKRQIEQRVEPEILLVFITQAIKQVNKLASLITDLLDITKIQAGKLKLNISSFQMHEVISETMMHMSNNHTVELINTVDEPVEADKTRIEQVITNYLSNAIKYSPGADKVIINVDKENDCIKVSVTDFGIGIPKDHLERVFDRFYRADEVTQRFSGLGLGLYISSEIIERHHGKYGVISEEGEGSTFWFCIPMKYTILPM